MLCPWYDGRTWFFACYPTEKFSTEPRARTPERRPRRDDRRQNSKFKFKTVTKQKKYQIKPTQYVKLFVK